MTIALYYKIFLGVLACMAIIYLVMTELVNLESNENEVE
jgi:hypothetical protein